MKGTEGNSLPELVTKATRIPDSPTTNVTRHILLFIALFVFWLLLSGMPVPFLIAAGAGSAAAVVMLTHHLDINKNPERYRIRLWPFISYCPWLIREILFSALKVSQHILHPRLSISPTLKEFSPSQSTELGLFIHANSITLTPGTISIEVCPGRFVVHALTHEGAAGLAGSEMDRRCAALEAR